MSGNTNGPGPDYGRSAGFQVAAAGGIESLGSPATHGNPRGTGTRANDGDVEPREVVRNAVIGMAERIGVKGNDLAAIIGVSPSTVSNMRRGASRALQGHAFENALMLIRTLDALYSLIASDEGVKNYLYSPHETLGHIPIEMMKVPEGLVDVTRHVEARLH